LRFLSPPDEVNDFQHVTVFQDGFRKPLARDNVLIMLDDDLQAIEAQLVEQFLYAGTGFQLARFAVENDLHLVEDLLGIQ
jgi:hypothetical protein